MKKIFCLIIFLIFLTINQGFCEEYRIIQVTDVLYNYTNSESETALKNLIQNLNSQKNVDFIVFTGNNLSKANQENLKKFLKELKQLKYPYYLTIGNKEVSKQKNLSKAEYFEILHKKVKSHKKIETQNYYICKKDIVFIVPEGAKDVISDSIGYYRPQTLDWIENIIKKFPNHNVVIIQHYPIIPPIKKEFKYTYKANEYLKLIEKYPNVKAVISGGFNTNCELEHNGILHISTQSAPHYRIIDVYDAETAKPTFWSTLK